MNSVPTSVNAGSIIADTEMNLVARLLRRCGRERSVNDAWVFIKNLLEANAASPSLAFRRDQHEKNSERKLNGFHPLVLMSENIGRLFLSYLRLVYCCLTHTHIELEPMERQITKDQCLPLGSTLSICVRLCFKSPQPFNIFIRKAMLNGTRQH